MPGISGHFVRFAPWDAFIRFITFPLSESQGFLSPLVKVFSTLRKSVITAF